MQRRTVDANPRPIIYKLEKTKLPNYNNYKNLKIIKFYFILLLTTIRKQKLLKIKSYKLQSKL